MTLTYGWINFLMQILGFHHKMLLIVLKWNHITFVINIMFVNPCIGISIIIDSTNIDVKDQIMLTHDSIHYFKKWIMNVLYLMMSCTKKKQNPNEPIHLFITRGVGTGKTFTLMFLIQALIFFCNKHPQLDPFKKNFTHDIYWKNNI
jgi:hypothetical protein